MSVYLINVCLILIFGYVFLHNYKSDKNTKIYCGLVALQWILISGLRHISVGADTDNYYRWFERVKTSSWSDVFGNVWDYLFHNTKLKDPGYDLLQKVFQIFCSDYQVFLIFIALLFTSFMAIWIYKNSKDPCFSFLLYSVLFYSFFALTGCRQTIATALVVFLGYKYIKDRKIVKFTLVAFAAFLIHKSSLVFAPYFLIANIPISSVYVIVSLVIILVISMMGSSFYGPVAEILGFDEELLLGGIGGGAETYAAVLTFMCIVILCFYYFYKDRTENATRIFNITLLTLMSSLLVFQNQGFMRIQQYYSLFLCVSFPEVIDSFEKKSKVFVYIVTITFLVLYLIRNNPKYLFFWQ